MPRTKAPPSPSTVKAPATCSGSPRSTYAATSSSLGLAKWTVVDAVTDRSAPLAVSRRQ
jgi:hypothetical protein